MALPKRTVAASAVRGHRSRWRSACTGSTTGQRRGRPQRRRHDHVLARLERRQRGQGHPGQRRRVREGVPEHPREGRRQHHRRQDQPGASSRRRQRPRRRLVVHDRQRRQVLHLQRLRRPRSRSWRSPTSTPRRPSRSRCSTTPSSRATVHAAVARRRLRPLLQQGRVQGGRHHEPPEDAVGVRGRRRQADQGEGRHLLAARVHAELPRLRVDDHALRRPVEPDVLRRRRQVDGRHRSGVRRDVQVAEGHGRRARRLRQAREVPDDLR